MKLMLTGGKGMLGRTICRVLGKDFEIVPTDLPEVDITSPESLNAALAAIRRASFSAGTSSVFPLTIFMYA